MAFALGAAVIGGGASLAGSALDYKAQKKALKQAEEDRVRTIGLIQQYGSNAIEGLTPAYQNAQNIQQQATNQNLQRTGDIFRPMVNTMQSGDYMAQQAALSGLMGQRNAILGDSINYGALQPQNVPVNFNALTGITNPQTLDYANFEVPNYEADRAADIDAALAAGQNSAEQDAANKNSSALGGALALGAGGIGLGLAIPSLLAAAGTGGFGAAVSGLGATALGAVKGVLGGAGAAVGTLLSNPLTWGAGALLLAVKNDFWKDPDGYVRSNSGLLVGPTPAAEGSDRAFDIAPFESGFQGTGFNRRGSQEDANKIIDVFREADSLITKAARNAGGNIDLSKATLNGVNEDGQYGTSGTFLGVGGKTSNLDLQVDFYAQQLANTITGLDADTLKQLKSAKTTVDIVNILENITATDANSGTTATDDNSGTTATDVQSDTKQGATFSTEQVKQALNSGATWGSNNSGSAP
jgi:hypothetical protein